MRIKKSDVRWWIENADRSFENKLQIVVSKEDADQRNDCDPFTVTDKLTGNSLKLRAVDCGAPCRCALGIAGRRPAWTKK